MPAETEPRDASEAADLPPRIVAVAYVLAAICAMLPLALLGALFAGGVLFNRGLRGHGMGVIVLSLACTAAGVVLLR